MAPVSERPTIEQVLAEFLEVQRARLAVGTYRRYQEIVELLKLCLNGYGHGYLGEGELRRFEEAYAAGDEEAFCHLFGPEKIVQVLDEFLGYFMIRKVGYGGQSLMRAAGTVTKRLSAWLAERGYVAPAAADRAVGRAAAAARELPRAERLRDILYEAAGRAEPIDLEALSDEDHVDDHLTIDRVEPGALWFEGNIGPVAVPLEASALAHAGWSVNVALVRTPRGWRLLEVGNVYP